METQKLTAQDLGFHRGWEIRPTEEYVRERSMLLPSRCRHFLDEHDVTIIKRLSGPTQTFTEWLALCGDGVLTWIVPANHTYRSMLVSCAYELGLVLEDLVGNQPCLERPGWEHQFWTWHVMNEEQEAI